MVKEEINKILNTNTAREKQNTLMKLMPELKFMKGFDHKHPHHHLDVWKHTLLALSKAPNNFDIRLSLLLHDIGKPHSYQNDGGISSCCYHFCNNYRHNYFCYPKSRV